MKKILLVTLQGANFGNRLQNYALQKSLEKMHCEVWTPYYDIPERDSLKKKIKYYLKAVLYLFGFKRFRNEYTHLVKEKSFKEFNKKYISNMFKISFKGVFDKKWEMFDFAITGSDQVWHKWSNKELELDYFYLQFISPQKRIAYASSFGFKSFPSSDFEQHKKGLLGMNKISCRETDAVSLIKEVIDCEPIVVSDPTFLLSKEQWTQIAKRPTFIKDRKYIFLYFLGRIPPQSLEVINSFSEANGYDIIDVINTNNNRLYKTKPDEFLWLISHAEYVFTDSYHATVFSLIFEKKFMVFKRVGAGYEQMFGRLETIVKKYGLESNVFVDEIKDVTNDYRIIKSRIESDVSKSLLYLNNCLN